MKYQSPELFWNKSFGTVSVCVQVSMSEGCCRILGFVVNTGLHLKMCHSETNVWLEVCVGWCVEEVIRKAVNLEGAKRIDQKMNFL